MHPFNPGTSYRDDPYIHFQHHMVPLLGMLDAALATDDRDLGDFVRRSFEWATAKGERTVGYFPEDIDDAPHQGSETCEVAGMIGLALKLSEGGFGDYWDDADRWIRNQFAENQLRRADWIYRFAHGGLVPPRRRVPPSALPTPQCAVDRVPERNVGAFAGWPAVNDFFTGQGTGLMHCCTGNGTRALYYVWEHILGFRDGTLRVNLLLNRPSRWADVLSHVPYQGAVEVNVKQPCRLELRIPEWVQPSEAAARVDGAARPLQWRGRYALVGSVTPGQVVRLTFPIAERVVGIDVEKRHYVVTLRGNDVVNIDPPGRFHPFYQRDAYRDGVVRWKKVQRFVSDEALVW